MNKKAVLGLDIVKSVILFLLLLAVIVIALFLTITSLVPVMTSIESTQTSGVTVGAAQGPDSLTTTGITLATCDSVAGGKITSGTTTLINATSGGTVSTGNYTISGCKIVGVSGTTYTNQNVNTTVYNFTYKVASQQTQSIQNNITSGTATLFAQVPTIMTILGVTIIIAAITIIILYVSRFGGRREHGL